MLTQLTRTVLRTNVRSVVLVALGGLVALSCGGGGSSSPTSPTSSLAASLPNITTFLSNPATTFVMDANGLSQLVAARPFMGTLSGCYNNNLTLYAQPKDVAYTIDMYSPVNGTVSNATTCESPSPGVVDQYRVGIDFASFNGGVVTLSMSGEPALHSDIVGVTKQQAYPCSGGVAGQDNGFFRPYVFVSVGQQVTVGQRVMQLYVFPISYYAGQKASQLHSTSDIQMNKQADHGAFACPNIFSSAIEAQVAAHYGDASKLAFSCNGAPYPAAICNLPAPGENIVGR